MIKNSTESSLLGLQAPKQGSNLSQNQLYCITFYQDEMAIFDAGCCTDMKIVFFKPKMPKGQYDSMKSLYNVTAMPSIEAGFYMDLSARAIDAVESMKK